jgi:tetratricopeptide (TPR) repeat protein
MRFAVLVLALGVPLAAHAADAPAGLAQKPAPADAAAPASAELDKLFAALAKATSSEEAKPIEDRIEALFRQSGSPTIDLLMARGQTALAAGDAEGALKLYNAVTTIAPTYAEGWHVRAQLQLLAGDDESAMLSLQKAIALNPRHFAAMAQLGGLLEDYGDKKAALALYRKVQALDPGNSEIGRHVRTLSRAVEGERI